MTHIYKIESNCNQNLQSHKVCGPLTNTIKTKNEKISTESQSTTRTIEKQNYTILFVKPKELLNKNVMTDG